MKILSADPGVTTGVVVDQDGTLTTWHIDSRNLQDFYIFLCGVKPDRILYEDFKHRPGLMKAELYSMQVIGVIRLYSEMHNTPIAFTCLPAEAKAFWDDPKIKKLALWEPSKKHAMDALRVLLTYKSKTDLWWYAEALQKLKD